MVKALLLVGNETIIGTIGTIGDQVTRQIEWKYIITTRKELKLLL